MLPNIPGVSETCRDSGSSEAVHDYAEIYTPSREGMNWAQSAQGPRPPTPPLHRFPSWEAKIYQASNDPFYFTLNPSVNEFVRHRTNEVCNVERVTGVLAKLLQFVTKQTHLPIP